MDLKNELSQAGLVESQYEECLQLIIDKKNGVCDLDWSEICDKYNLQMSNESLRKASGGVFGGAFVAEYLRNKGKAVEPVQTVENIQSKYSTETSINKDGTYSSNKLIVMNEEESKDPEYILKAHGFDPNSWRLVSARNNIRQGISSQDGVVTLYASFITVKPISEREISLSKIEEFFGKLDRNYSLPVLKENYGYKHGDKMLLIDIADLHMNLQASMFTTGNEYNCDIAERLFFKVIEDILSRTQHYDFEEIVFVVGGDMLNADGLSGTTTKGTPQDNDVHYYDAYERLCAMTIKAIDLLKDRCKVNVIYVMGNHDEVTGFKLAKYIDAWFRNDEMVFVDYRPVARKYKLYGHTLLCFAHDGDVRRLPAIISNEARDLWSKSEATEVFLQHCHTEQVLMEDNNIRIQRLPTISARSKWSCDKGFGNKRQCKSFIFDAKDGLTDVLYTPIRQVAICDG